MKKCVYFASEDENFPRGPGLTLGFGFTRTGQWRPKKRPATEVLAVDDRFPPSPAGLREAVRFLDGWTGWILWDLEKPPRPDLLELLRRIPERSVVPPAWADAPHAAVLIGPYVPGCSFRRWLDAKKKRFGAVVLDAAPIRCRCIPGRPPLAWTGPLPAEGRACPGAFCLCAADGSACCYWDSRETLIGRCGAAGVPAVILTPEWDRLP